ncbi:unnamed protein product [Schistosoma mattheei]|uniref:EGF-like domain-containing protein n=1 Tax=Schistosoma mattheei TaxID=31246 RepID=A0AA85ARI4_9TREM|nr:unnamed protein product [Schistosoma mattheei]
MKTSVEYNQQCAPYCLNYGKLEKPDMPWKKCYCLCPDNYYGIACEFNRNHEEIDIDNGNNNNNNNNQLLSNMHHLKSNALPFHMVVHHHRRRQQQQEHHLSLHVQ